MAATRSLSIANCALNDVNQLILAETELDGGADSNEDVVNLRATQQLLTTYIAATSNEVGTPEDLEAIEADVMNSLIRNAAGYYPSC